MSDETTEVYRALREWKKTEKQASLKSGREALEAAGVAFQVKNAGYHYVVSHEGRTVDYWPSTGRWRERVTGEPGNFQTLNSKRHGKGHETLLKSLGITQ